RFHPGSFSIVLSIHTASRLGLLLLSALPEVGGLRACVQEACTGRRPAGWNSGPGATRRRAGAGVSPSRLALQWVPARKQARGGQEPGHQHRLLVRAPPAPPTHPQGRTISL